MLPRRTTISIFPDSIFQRGGQPVGAQWASPWSKVYFVDALDGKAGADGLKPTSALSTIAAATAKAVRGDVIYIRPLPYAIGHGMERYTECVTITATNTALNLAGDGTSYPLLQPSDISIIGCVNTSNPEMGVRWKVLSTTYCLINDSPALHVENIGFFAEDATAAIYLRCDGTTDTKRGMDGTTFYNCTIKGSGLYGASGGDGLTIKGCTFYTKYDGTSGGIGAINITCSANPGLNLKILNNIFYGGSTTATPYTDYITIAPPMSMAVIAHNQFGTLPTGGQFIEASGAANTGQIHDNFFTGAITLETEEHIGGMLQSGNWEVGGIMV